MTDRWLGWARKVIFQTGAQGSSLRGKRMAITMMTAMADTRIFRKNRQDFCLFFGPAQILINSRGTAMTHQAKDRQETYSSRQNLVEVLDEEITRAKRYVKPLSLLLLSIDWDGGGDRSPEKSEREDLMRQMTELFTKNVRAIDRVYLYQPGVFAVLLPETDKVEALTTAKRLRKIVQQARLTFPGHHNGSVKPVLHIGLVSYPWDANARPEMFKAAEFALNQAMGPEPGHICFLDFEYQHLRNGSQTSYKIRSV
jgi:diguanylate cyclase (GGDEF)-like protein